MQFLRSRNNRNKLQFAANQIVAIDDIELEKNGYGLMLYVTNIKDGIGSYMIYKDVMELFREWELVDGIGGEVRYGEISGVD